MKNPKTLTNEALLSNAKSLVAEERKLTTSILWHLHEIQVRRLYAEKGYASLFEFAVQVLGYSEAAAGRRIAAMRLLVEIPEIEPALKNGQVNLSTLSTIQSFIQRKEAQRKEAKINGTKINEAQTNGARTKTAPISKQEKRDLVFALQGKSRRECEKHLVALDPQAATPKEKERIISPTQTEIRFVADDALMEKLKEIKELDGHVQNNSSYLELFHRLADIALKKLDPLKSEKTKNLSPQAAVTPPAESEKITSHPVLMPTHVSKAFQTQTGYKVAKNQRFIPAALKRAIWKRDHAQCSYQSSDGKRCSSRFALEIDHIQPLALGGKTEVKNLRLLCRAHNRQQAIMKLGQDAMLPFLR